MKLTPQTAAKAIGALATAGLVFFAGTRFESSQVDIRGDGNVVVHSPTGFQCPKGFEQTAGTEPVTNNTFVVCGNSQYLITLPTGKPAVGMELKTGRFLTSDEIKVVLGK